ncbi:MAG: hypothetical protein K2N12_02995 [Helicobacter sp.]|nr:hypothetical protein [Helicobacter sp.]
MLITTNTNVHSPIIVKPQAQKTEEVQEFVNRLSTEESKALAVSAIQKQTQEFPKGLLQDIESLSNLMLELDDDAYSDKKHGGVGYVYSNENGNKSFVLGDYEYVLSKTDESLNLDDLKHVWGYGTHSNLATKDNIQNGMWLDGNSYVLWTNDNFDKTRYRPFGSSIMYDPKTSSSFAPEPEAFPEILNRQPDMGYTYVDFESNLGVIEKLLDKYLLAEYEKDPRSDETQQLLFLKAKINTISEMVEKDREIVAEYLQLDDTLFTAIFTHRDLWANQTAMLAEFGLNLNKFLPEDEQQQVIDSLNVILNYSDHHWFEGFGAEISSLFKQDNIMASQLKESSKEFQESLISRFSAIDNTEILLNLASDSSLQTNTKESKTYESLIDRIRSKLKGNDDSILQQVMSKITNGVKASGIAEGV